MFERISKTGSLRLLGVTAAVCLAAASASADTASNLACSKCVGASDLADGAAVRSKIRNFAVNSSKLAGSAVISAKLATGAVTRAKIRDFAVNGSKIAGSAVSTAKIATGAVTSAKIANGGIQEIDIADGAIGAEKLGLTNTTFVEASGSDTANCTALLDALTGLVGPAAVVLGPGTYACGAAPVVLPPQVSLIGSGQNLTTITGNLDSVN